MTRPAPNRRLPALEGDRLRLLNPSDDARDEGGDTAPTLRREGPDSPAQQLYCELIEAAYPELQSRAAAGEEGAKGLLAGFLRLGEHLGVRLWNPAETVPDSANAALALLQECVAQCGGSRRRRTGFSSTATSPSATPATWSLTCTPWASATATPRPSCRPAPAAATATTSATTAGSTPTSAARRSFEALCRRPARARHGADPRRRAQPHGHRRRRQRLVDGRAGERPRLPLRPLLRHRLAARSTPTWRTRCCCRCWRTSTAGCWRPARSAWPTRTGPSPCGTTRHRLPVAPCTYPADPASTRWPTWSASSARSTSTSASCAAS